MKARIANSLSARCGGGCPPRRTYTRERTARGTQPREENGKKAGVLLEKDGRKEGKEDEFRKKVHKFLFSRRLISREQKLFLAKTTDIQNKKFTFALDKTQLSLFLPHCGVHIARNHGATRTNRRKCSLTY